MLAHIADLELPSLHNYVITINLFTWELVLFIWRTLAHTLARDTCVSICIFVFLICSHNICQSSQSLLLVFYILLSVSWCLISVCFQCSITPGVHTFYNNAMLTSVGMNPSLWHRTTISSTVSGSLQSVSYPPSLLSYIHSDMTTLISKRPIL